MTSATETLKPQIRAMLCAYLQHNPAIPCQSSIDILPDNADLRDFGLDSINTLEFFAEVESQFNICFEGGELDMACIHSIDAIAALIASKTAPHAA